MDLKGSKVALVVKTPPANAGDEILGFDPWVGKIPWGQVHVMTHSSILA